MDLGTISAVGFVLSILSIPFLSDSITMSAIADYKYPVAGILEENITDFDTQDAQKYPGSVTKSIGPEEFSYETETAFGSFSIEISNIDNELKIEESLSNPNAKIFRKIISDDEIVEEWIFQTNIGTLKTIKSPGIVKEEFSTASGTCYKEKSMGNNKEYCNGQIHQIDGIWDEQKELMNQYADNLIQVSNEIELLNIESSQWDY